MGLTFMITQVFLPAAYGPQRLEGIKSLLYLHKDLLIIVLQVRWLALEITAHADLVHQLLTAVFDLVVVLARTFFHTQFSLTVIHRLYEK